MATAAVSIDARQERDVKLGEIGIRGRLTKSPAPLYPPAAVAARKSGVVVAAVVFSSTGALDQITVLEAPDPSIAQAVTAAVKQWTVGPTTIGYPPVPARATGKLTFYFQIAGGRGQVRNPQDMPNGPEITLRPPAPPAGAPPPPPAAPRPAPTVTSHSVDAADELGPAELEALRRTTPITMLDTRTREEFARAHSPGAINIPFDELAVRARIELDAKKPVVVDCSQQSGAWCANSSAHLKTAKFARVLVYLP